MMHNLNSCKVSDQTIYVYSTFKQVLVVGQTSNYGHFGTHSMCLTVDGVVRVFS